MKANKDQTEKRPPSEPRAPRVKTRLRAGIVIDITGAGVKKPTLGLGGQDFW